MTKKYFQIMKNNHTVVLKCFHCVKIFKNTRGLDKHSQKVHRQSIATTNCSFCPAPFLAHTLVLCDICHLTVTHLDQHIRQHIDIKFKLCQFCHCFFAYNYYKPTDSTCPTCLTIILDF